jgi:hypothetical protein
MEHGLAAAVARLVKAIPETGRVDQPRRCDRKTTFTLEGIANACFLVLPKKDLAQR